MNPSHFIYTVARKHCENQHNQPAFSLFRISMGWFCLYGLLAVLANTLRTRSSRKKSQSARSRTCRSPAARTTLSMCQCAMMMAEIHQNPWIQSWYMDVSENRAPYFQMACFEKRKKSPIQTAIQCGMLASRFRWKPSIAKSVQTSTFCTKKWWEIEANWRNWSHCTNSNICSN